MTVERNLEEATGSCHCGAVKFRVKLLDGLRKPVRCNCTMCRMKGAVMVFAPLGSITVIQGEDMLASYEFHSKVAKHRFCSKCGIHLFHQRRLDPDQYGVNVAVLDGVSPFDFAEVPVFNGQDHPKDRGGGRMGIAGIMRYERNPD
jgi:hypothetical protein